MESVMNKNIIVSLIAGSFFAASIVAPAFATGGSDAPPGATHLVSGQQLPDPTKGIPEINLPDRLPSVDVITERLENLDLEAILDRDDIPVPRLPGPVVLPDLEPVEPAEPAKPTELPPAVELPDDEPEVDESPDVSTADVEARSPVKSIEKASILAAHGGDRRAAKAELKAAQKRMVSRIKASNGAAGKAKRNR